MARNFTKLKKTMTQEDFDKFCKKLTEEYARSEAQFARTYFCKSYNISPSCFYKVLEHAVTTNLVSDATVIGMFSKAVINQNDHCKGAGSSSLRKYAEMNDKRSAYIAEHMPAEDIRDFAQIYVDNLDISLKDLATAFGVDKRTAKLMLRRSVIENRVSDRTVDLMEERTIQNSIENKEHIKKCFARLRQKRKEYIESEEKRVAHK